MSSSLKQLSLIKTGKYFQYEKRAGTKGLLKQRMNQRLETKPGQTYTAICLFCCFFHFYTISVIIRCQELPDEVVQSKPHLSEVFTLANNKLQGQQGLPVEAQMEGVSCSESLGSCIF